MQRRIVYENGVACRGLHFPSTQESVGDFVRRNVRNRILQDRRMKSSSWKQTKQLKIDALNLLTEAFTKIVFLKRNFKANDGKSIL